MTSVIRQSERSRPHEADDIYEGIEELEQLAGRFADGEFDDLRAERMDALLDNMPDGYRFDDNGRLINPAGG